MKLLAISWERFRNLADACLELAPGTTVLLGENGQGKTSVLEAMGVLATTKSFRGSRAAEMARHGESGFRVAGTVEGSSGPVRLETVVDRGVRTTHEGGVEATLADYIGHLTVVPVTLAHAGIVRGAPQERRDFLDRGILGVRPSYLRTLSAWRRGLRQVNALLRSEARHDNGFHLQLSAWCERLVRDAAEIVLRRRLYVQALRQALVEVGPRFLPPGEQLELELSDCLDGEGEGLDRAGLAGLLLARVEAGRERSVAQRQLVVGPHRDDLALRTGGRDLRRFASSGQQRNALLALKVAKVEVFRSQRHETPLLLVDDVDTEIDAVRLARFLEQVGGRTQAVLTSSKRDLFRQPGDRASFWTVRGGVLSPARGLQD